MVSVNDIVTACVEIYKKVIKKAKPSENEWTVISAVVGVINKEDIQVLSMGTGSKCIGKTFMSSKGDILNDSHAEVIARRAFLKYLYDEIVSFNKKFSSNILYYDDFSYHIKDSVKFHFVTSMSPCGDASIMPKFDSTEHNTMSECSNASAVCSAERPKRKSSPTLAPCGKHIKLEVKQCESISNPEPDIHRTGAKCLPNSTIQDFNLPGVLYHNTAAVRTKPGRGDPTLSLSCSDKIARWNAVGWQGALLSLLIKQPIFMESIICGGGCPFSKEAFDRAFNERIKRETFVPVHQSTMSFPDVKTAGKKPSSLSLIWTKTAGKEVEVAVNGRRQGITKKNANRKCSRISICKKELFLLFKEVFNTHPDGKKFVEGLGLQENEFDIQQIKYGPLKMLSMDYQKRWSLIKNECFKVWTEKPRNLLDFNVEDD